MTDFYGQIKQDLKDQIISSEEENDMIYIKINKENNVSVLEYLKNDMQFQVITDVFASDFPEREKRFELIYNLLSFQKNARICVKIDLEEDETIETICDVFSGANWYEREVYDMFGIEFINHPDLRRILTDYGFRWHPLRKDFPLTGYVELRYDDDKKAIIHEPVSLTQEFRSFDFDSPWEGVNYEIPNSVLPGDEKAKMNQGEE